MSVLSSSASFSSGPKSCLVSDLSLTSSWELACSRFQTCWSHKASIMAVAKSSLDCRSILAAPPKLVCENCGIIAFMFGDIGIILIYGFHESLLICYSCSRQKERNIQSKITHLDPKTYYSLADGSSECRWMV
jgi:hypothetical protein